MGSRKIAIATNYIPEYRFAVFDALVREHGYELRFFVSAETDRSCEQARKTLTLHHSRALNIEIRSRHRAVGTVQREQMPIPIALPCDLLRFRPEMIISGDFGLRSFVCLAIARLLRVPFIIWSEEIRSSARGRSRLQKFCRKFLSVRADACLAWGKPAAEYLEAIGVPTQRIHRAVQAIDNGFWVEHSSRLSKQEVRSALGIRGIMLLAVGRLVERKGFMNLLRALLRVPAELRHACTTIIVGSGDQEGALKEFASTQGMRNVKFVGTLPPEELVRYYVAADALVFPSLEDVWGMVVNEALCCGTPVLGSVHAGAAQELVTEESGELFDPCDIDLFGSRLTKWIAAPPMTAAAAVQIRKAFPTQAMSADAIARMLRELLSEPPAASFGGKMRSLSKQIGKGGRSRDPL